MLEVPQLTLLSANTAHVFHDFLGGRDLILDGLFSAGGEILIETACHGGQFATDTAGRRK